MMKQRRRMLSKPYTEVNYLGATGAQFFSTGVIPNNNTGIVIKIRPSVANAYSFAVRQGDYRYYAPVIAGTGSRWAYGIGAYVQNTTYSGVLGNDYTATFNLNGSGQVLIDGALIDTLTPSINMTNPALLFGNYVVGGTPYPSDYYTGRIYYCKVYDGTTLIRDYIPVLDGSGIPCMFDKVGRKFYYNQGTGVFNYG